MTIAVRQNDCRAQNHAHSKQSPLPIIFVVRRIKNARRIFSLLCACHKSHGKHVRTCMPRDTHATWTSGEKRRHMVVNFAVRLSKTHNRVLCLPCVLWRRMTKFHVCRAFYATLLSQLVTPTQIKGGSFSWVVLQTGIKESPTSYYKRIASST
jgi:hypothetical protein